MVRHRTFDQFKQIPGVHLRVRSIKISEKIISQAQKVTLIISKRTIFPFKFPDLILLSSSRSFMVEEPSVLVPLFQLVDL
jgi:hypothetical protein